MSNSCPMIMLGLETICLACYFRELKSSHGAVWSFVPFVLFINFYFILFDEYTPPTGATNVVNSI